MANKKKSKKREAAQEFVPEKERSRLAHDPARERIVPKNRIMLTIAIVAFSAWTLFLAWIAYRVNF